MTIASNDYYVTCDKSGFKCKRSECRTTWDNKIVRADFWEPRHPQDIIRPYSDDQSVKDGRNQIPDPAGFVDDMYYDRFLTYDTLLSYEAPTFDLSFAI
jgi:hypothetical protein